MGMTTNHTTTRPAALRVTKEFYTENMEQMTNWKNADMVIFAIDEVNENEVEKAIEKIEKAVATWCKSHDAEGEIVSTEKNSNGTLFVSAAATKI